MSPPPPPPPPPPPAPASGDPSPSPSLPKPPPTVADASSLTRLGAFSRQPRPTTTAAPADVPPRALSHPRTVIRQQPRDPRLARSPPAPAPAPARAAQHSSRVSSIQQLVQPSAAASSHAPPLPPSGALNAAALLGDTTRPAGDGFAPLTANFGGLVRKILAHPLLPLVVGEVHETASGRPVEVCDTRCSTALRAANARLAAVVASARIRGLDAAASQPYELLDVYLAALCAAFSSLRANTPPPVPQPLHAMLSAAHLTPPAPADPYATRESEVGRSKIPEHAKAILESWFAAHFDSPYPQESEKRKLAQETGLRMNQINNYFGNRRMRTKRKRLEQDANAAKGGATLGASVLAPRTKWRTIVRPDDLKAMHPFHNELITRDSHDAHNALVSNLFRGSSVSTDDDHAAPLPHASIAASDSTTAAATSANANPHSERPATNNRAPRW